jgi:NitT/TauT family transport system substrate-binding protein
MSHPLLRRGVLKTLATALILSPLAVSAQALLPAKVAIIPTLEAAPLLLARDRGFFKEAGLDVKIEVGTSGATILPGVLSGQYDIGYANVVSDLQAIDRKLPLLLLHATYSHPADPAKDAYRIYVAPDSKIREAKQLATANIGTPYINNISEWTTKKALENIGVRDFSQLRWTKVSGEDAYASVKSGAIDAVWLAQPAGAAAVRAGLKPVLSVNSGSMPGAVGGYFITSKRYAQQQPEVLKRFNAAISKANAYAGTHPKESRDAVIAAFHFDKELVYAADLNDFPSGQGIEKLRTIAKDVQRYGLTQNVADVDGIFWKPVHE